MNKLTIIGNLTSDPQSHTAPSGKEVCNFTVAVNRRKKVQGQPDADFFRCAAWEGKAKSCQQYLSKGRRVCVIGPVSVSTYTAQDGTVRANMEVFAEEVEFLGGGNSGDQMAQTESSGTPVNIDESELPF